jgi:hypothetical protein
MTDPNPLSIEADAASVEFQERTLWPPDAIEPGVAVITQVGFGVTGVTVTVVEQTALAPFVPTAVIVYLVVAVMLEITRVPTETGESAPIPWSIEADAAFDELQKRTAASPTKGIGILIELVSTQG